MVNQIAIVHFNPVIILSSFSELRLCFIDPSGEDIVAIVLSIEGDPEEEGGVMSSEEADITCKVETGAVDVVVVPTCCRFAGVFLAVRSDTFK